MVYLHKYFMLTTVLMHISTHLSPFLEAYIVYDSQSAGITKKSSGGMRLDDSLCDKPLSECLVNLLNENIATDITFLVGKEKLPVHAHKLVLISRNPVFYALLHGPDAEKGDIEIPDITKETFLLLLQYMYSDKITLDVHIVIPVMGAARKYHIDRLKEECRLFINKSINIQNVGVLLEEAYAYMEEGIMSLCLSFIHVNAEGFLLSESFTSLSHECLYLITKADELIITAEQVVFEAAFNWSTKECKRQNLEITDKNRRKVLGKTVYEIRFPFISDDYLFKEICSTDFLSGDEIKEVFRMKHKKVTSDIFKNIPRRECKSSKFLRFSELHEEQRVKKYGINKYGIRFTVSRDGVFTGFCINAIYNSVKLQEIEVFDNEENKLAHMRVVLVVSVPGPYAADVMLDQRVLIKKDTQYEAYITVNPISMLNFGLGGNTAVTIGSTTVQYFDITPGYNGRYYMYIQGIMFC